MKYKFGGRASGKTHECISQVLNSRAIHGELNTARTILIVAHMEIKVLLMQNYELGHREIFTISEALDGKVNEIQFDNYVIDELESVLHAIFRKNILFCTDTPTEVTAKYYEDNPYISDKLKEELMRRVKNYEY